MKTIFKPLLFLLTVLVLHSAEATVQKEGNPYTFKSDDTLYDIAQAYYGNGNRWQEIAQANGIDVNNPIGLTSFEQPVLIRMLTTFISRLPIRP